MIYNFNYKCICLDIIYEYNILCIIYILHIIYIFFWFIAFIVCSLPPPEWSSRILLLKTNLTWFPFYILLYSVLERLPECFVLLASKIFALEKADIAWSQIAFQTVLWKIKANEEVTVREERLSVPLPFSTRQKCVMSIRRGWPTGYPLA